MATLAPSQQVLGGTVTAGSAGAVPGVFGNVPDARLRATQRAARVAAAGGDMGGVPALGAPGHFERTQRSTSRAAAATVAASSSGGDLDAWEAIEAPRGGDQVASVTQVLAELGEGVVDVKDAFDGRSMDGLLPPEEVGATLTAIQLPRVDGVRELCRWCDV